MRRIVPVPAVLFIRRRGAPFGNAMHQRFRVLELASLASGEQAAAFLAAVRCLVSTAAGVDHIDLAECARRGVVVANSGTVYSADVADHAVGMLVVVLRRVSAAERFVRRRLWLLQDGGYPLASKVPSNLLFFIPVSELIS